MKDNDGNLVSWGHSVESSLVESLIAEFKKTIVELRTKLEEAVRSKS